MNLLSTAIMLFGIVLAAAIILLGSWDYIGRRPVAAQGRFSLGRMPKPRGARVVGR